jgi:Zn-dependent protease with chaperone function
VAALVVLGIVAIGCVPAAGALAAADWPRRSPAVGIALWQALGLAWGLATIGCLASLGTVGMTDAGRLSSADADARFVVSATGLRSWSLVTGLRLLALVAAACLLAVLVWILVAASVAVLRARHRQRRLLGLLAHGDPKVPGALVVDYPAAAAYCVPGLRSAIVISAGTLALLGQAELAAVLAHERAHLRARHDLVLLPFTALLRAFRWSATARDANRAVAMLVEMLADDRARRCQPAKELAMALLRVGSSPAGGRVPAGTLGVVPTTASGELAARVSRLLRPPRGLPVPVISLVVTTAAVLALAPPAALLLPW